MFRRVMNTEDSFPASICLLKVNSENTINKVSDMLKVNKEDIRTMSSLSYRSHYIDVLRKSMNWFLYNRERLVLVFSLLTLNIFDTFF